MSVPVVSQSASGKQLAAMLRLLADSCEASRSDDERCTIHIDYPVKRPMLEGELHRAVVRVEFDADLDALKVYRVLGDFP